MKSWTENETKNSLVQRKQIRIFCAQSMKFTERDKSASCQVLFMAVFQFCTGWPQSSKYFYRKFILKITHLDLFRVSNYRTWLLATKVSNMTIYNLADSLYYGSSSEYWMIDMQHLVVFENNKPENTRRWRSFEVQSTSHEKVTKFETRHRSYSADFKIFFHEHWFTFFVQFSLYIRLSVNNPKLY